jgi:enamine deaminase RidA (YjgF/YER057c/UK114 family)
MSQNSKLPYAPYRVVYGTPVFFSGQIGLKDGALVSGVMAETEQTIENIRAVLKKAGVVVGYSSSDLWNIVQARVFLTDMRDYPIVNEVWLAKFGDWLPARTCVAVKELPLGAHVEVEVVAAFP